MRVEEHSGLPHYGGTSRKVYTWQEILYMLGKVNLCQGTSRKAVIEIWVEVNAFWRNCGEAWGFRGGLED